MTSHDLAMDMVRVYNASKHDPTWLCDDECDDPYCRVYYAQMWIPDIYDDVDEILRQHGLWLETGEGDPTDLYVCGVTDA